MNVIAHQAPCEHTYLHFLKVVRDQFEIYTSILLRIEDIHMVNTALGDMVGDSGANAARLSRHQTLSVLVAGPFSRSAKGLRPDGSFHLGGHVRLSHFPRGKFPGGFGFEGA